MATMDDLQEDMHLMSSRQNKPWTRRRRSDGRPDLYLEDHYFMAIFPAILRQHGRLLSEIAIIEMTWQFVDQILLTREKQIQDYLHPLEDYDE